MGPAKLLNGFGRFGVFGYFGNFRFHRGVKERYMRVVFFLPFHRGFYVIRRGCFVAG